MAQPRLTLGKAALLMLGLGTGALMGVPGFGTKNAPAGPIEGIVRADAGTPIVGAEVVLFDDDSLSLLEITQTDAQGRFAFGQEPERFHVFANPPQGADDELVAGWAFDRIRSSSGGIEIELFDGQRTQVQVRDASGAPLPNVEVRVLDAAYETPCVVQRVLTDHKGEISILMPKEAHIGVLGSEEQPAHWLTNIKHSEASKSLEIQLPAGKILRGSLLASPGAPLEGGIVSAWDLDREVWCGWAKSAADGSYAINVPAEGVQLRVVDPGGEYLPLEQTLQADELQDQQWRMRAGQEQEILIEGLGEARVWAWSAETQAWGWGILTDEQGSLNTALAPHHSVVAVPVNSNLSPQEAWNREIEPVSLQLTQRPVEEK
jgi:hypothetical protein